MNLDLSTVESGHAAVLYCTVHHVKKGNYHTGRLVLMGYSWQLACGTPTVQYFNIKGTAKPFLLQCSGKQIGLFHY